MCIVYGHIQFFSPSGATCFRGTHKYWLWELSVGVASLPRYPLTFPNHRDREIPPTGTWLIMGILQAL